MLNRSAASVFKTFYALGSTVNIPIYIHNFLKEKNSCDSIHMYIHHDYTDHIIIAICAQKGLLYSPDDYWMAWIRCHFANLFKKENTLELLKDILLLYNLGFPLQCLNTWTHWTHLRQVCCHIKSKALANKRLHEEERNSTIADPEVQVSVNRTLL